MKYAVSFHVVFMLFRGILKVQHGIICRRGVHVQVMSSAWTSVVCPLGPGATTPAQEAR